MIRRLPDSLRFRFAWPKRVNLGIEFMTHSEFTLNEGPDEPLPFEKLLTEISTSFISLSADQIDSEIGFAQSRICELLDLDRSTLWITSDDDPQTVILTHVHQALGQPPPAERMNAKDFFPWMTQKLLSGETVAFSQISELPAEARRDRESFEFYGTKSGVYVPFSVGKGPVFGMLTFAATREERRWSRRALEQFRLIAQIFANALARKHAEKSLEDRLRFEMLLTDISARFVNLPWNQVDGEIENAQRLVCECLGLDLCALWQWSSENSDLLLLTHIYRSQEEPALPEPMDAKLFFPWSRDQIEAGKIIVVKTMSELLPEAARDFESYGYFGIKSTCVFPLVVGDHSPIGALGFNTLQAEFAWPEAIIKRLQLVAQIFANALARERSERELVQSERRLRLITNALPVLIAYVDAECRYRFNNDAHRVWFGVKAEDAFGRHIQEVLGEAFFQCVSPYVRRALSGEHLQCALDLEQAVGRPLSAEAIYVPDVGRQGAVRGVYILVIDVTERNLAQQESSRLQDELLHAGRISTMGELAGALAHEINQPLSAIMSNAQAAQRYLSGPTPDLEEVREILNDILKEDSRASEIINRIRLFLRKSKMEIVPLDLNSIFREIAKLLTHDAARRAVEIKLELDPNLPLVRGDRIQLQQVALNLMLNAFESMNRKSHRKRCVQIRTGLNDSEVVAAIKDKGSGISLEDAGKVFEPFYTTRAEGLGMGLAICRSIILRHQGRIWAENNPDRGATFYFSLPVSADDRVVRPSSGGTKHAPRASRVQLVR